MTVVNYLDSTSRSVQLRESTRSAREVGVFQCLIASPSDVRVAMMADAATAAGWNVTVEYEPTEAFDSHQRSVFKLILVDLEACPNETSNEEFRALTTKISLSSGSPLVIVCGHIGQPEEEIWARQLGVWLYVPALSDDFGVSQLCDHARDAVQRTMTFAG